MAITAWQKVKAAITPARAQAPRADVLVGGPAPVVDPGPEARREKKRAVLLSGLLEAASRRRRGL